MQREILEGNPDSDIRIFAVNGNGAEPGIDLAVQGGRTLPILQDTATDAVWDSWNVRYRDVVILDRENRAVAAFNLTEHDLTRGPEYDALLRILRREAGE